MKTIFYEQNQLHLSAKLKPGYKHVFDNPGILQLKFIVDLFLQSKNYEGLIVGNKEAIFKQIKKHFEHIRAAGGLVMNKKNEILLIHRLGKWDLPKGKLETGESKKAGAIREVEEECGIHGVTITKKLKPSYHVYPIKNGWVLKTSYWYLMNYRGTEPLVPQAEENITRAIWLDKSKFDTKVYDTYPAIAKVLRQSLFQKE